MPQKAQLLVQLAQVAARESRQQGVVLPQVAANVWDTLAGGSQQPALAGLQAQQQAQQQQLGGALSSLHQWGGLLPGRPPCAAGSQGASAERLAASLSFLQLQQQAASSDAAAAPPGAPGGGGTWPFGGGVALPMQLPGQPRRPLFDHGRPVAAAGGASAHASSSRRGPSAAHPAPAHVLGGAAGIGGVRKPRFSSAAISLNKQIMATHSTRELHALVRSKGDSMDFFNVSSAIAKVPKLVPPGGVQGDAAAKALVDDLAGLMAAHIGSFDARGLANSAWAFAKLKHTPPGGRLPALIAAAARDKLPGFSAQNLSNLLWAFVYLHHRDEGLLAAASREVVAKVGELKPQELSNVVWALASLEHYDAQLMGVLGRAALAMLPAFKEQELSNVVWAYAKLGHARADAPLFDRLLDAAKQKLPQFQPQGVSNIAWALAAAGRHDERLLEALLSHCREHMAAYDVQGLSNMLWACATLGHHDPAFVAAAARECGVRAERMSAQNLGNVLWACATLGHGDARLLGLWADAAMHKLDMFEPQGLANAAWGFAKLGARAPALFEGLASAALAKLECFTPQGLAHLAWALAAVGHYHPALMAQLSDAALLQAGRFSPAQCSSLLWACATLRHHHQAAFDALLARLAACDVVDAAAAPQLGPQSVANALWALARLDHAPAAPQHVRALVAAAKRLLPAMAQHELCSAVWALAVLGALDVDTWERFCECAASVQGLEPEGVHQAFHAQLMLHSALTRSSGDGGGGPLAAAASGAAATQLPRLPEPLASAARRMWAASAVDALASRLQADVSGALWAAGLPHAVDVLTDDGLFAVDIALRLGARRVALQVDGPHHFTASAPRRPTSEVAVRRRLLQDRGWDVVSVGSAEWEALPDDPRARAAALLGLLAAELGAAPGSLVPPATPAVSDTSVHAALGAPLQASDCQQQQQRRQSGGWAGLGMVAMPGGVLASAAQLTPALGVWGNGTFISPPSEAALPAAGRQHEHAQDADATSGWAALGAPAGGDAAGPAAKQHLLEALAAAQAQWRASSPACGAGAGRVGAGSSSAGGVDASPEGSTGSGSSRPAAAFMWGDPNAASIWAP